MCLCLFVITKFYLIIPNFHTDMPFKRDRLVNFYILLEKCEKIDTSATALPSSTKFGVTMQNVYLKCTGRWNV